MLAGLHYFSLKASVLLVGPVYARIDGIMGCPENDIHLFAMHLSELIFPHCFFLTGKVMSDDKSRATFDDMHQLKGPVPALCILLVLARPPVALYPLPDGVSRSWDGLPAIRVSHCGLLGHARIRT